LVPVVSRFLSFSFFAVEAFFGLIALGKHPDPQGQGPVMSSRYNTLVDAVGRAGVL